LAAAKNEKEPGTKEGEEMRRRRYQRGDVVIVPVTYAGGRGQKRRPVVVISSDAYHAAQPANTIVARISANVSGHQTATDYTLQDWQAAGLHEPSVVTSFLVTIEPLDILARIGHLSHHDLKGVETRLRLALNLP
jgi:mRNA-degrading endonuclease toxin of MazEF toxin-antitoxin module